MRAPTRTPRTFELAEINLTDEFVADADASQHGGNDDVEHVLARQKAPRCRLQHGGDGDERLTLDFDVRRRQKRQDPARRHGRHHRRTERERKRGHHCRQRPRRARRQMRFGVRNHDVGSQNQELPQAFGHHQTYACNRTVSRERAQAAIATETPSCLHRRTRRIARGYGRTHRDGRAARAGWQS